MRESNVKRKTVYLLLILLLASCSSGTSSQGGYQKSIKAVDETGAIQTLRTIATAQAQSKTTRGSYGDFNDLVQAGLLDQRFASTSPDLNGYRFTMRAGENEFSVNAEPQKSDESGATAGRYFYLDSSDGTIHVNAAKTATKSDPAL